MKITIIGNLGYVGPVLTSYIRRLFPEIKIAGIDAGYFSCSYLDHTQLSCVDVQLFKDVSKIIPDDLAGSDAVIYLAAISNDPMGRDFAAATKRINQDQAVRIAKMVDQIGVKSFVFASSCSVYGSASDKARIETDDLNPLTDYARSKVNAEQQMKELDLNNTKINSLRFATACGVSANLRLDLVLNDFVYEAVINDEVKVLSDGSPLRPLIDVTDMARFLTWFAINENAPSQGIFNAGFNSCNYSVLEIANCVSNLTGCSIDINTSAPPDKRSYKVNFDAIGKLTQFTRPLKNLENSCSELKDFILQVIKTRNVDMKLRQTRLHVIKEFIEKNNLNQELLK